MKRILFTALTSAIAAGTCQASVVAHWSFDNDFADSSANSNDLVVGVGTPTISSTAGEVKFGGGALDLDSTVGTQEYLNLTNAIDFVASDAWTVSFWARHRPGNDGRTGMVVGDLTSADFIWIPRDGVIGGLRFRNSSSQNADYTSPPAGVEPAGVYHHWVVIADGAGNIEVFYDNSSLGSQSIATTLDITSVGQAFNQNTQSYDGQIDELYIFDEAIDSGTVASLFNSNVVPEPGSLALLAFGGMMMVRRRR